MRFKILLLVLVSAIWFTACKELQHNYVIVGNISGMPVQNVVLEQLGANDIITIVDSQKSDKKGHFVISGVTLENGLYRLHFTANKYILLCINNGNINIDANWDQIQDYAVSGSDGSKNLKTFLSGIREHLRDINTMNLVIDTLQVRGNDSILGVAKKEMKQVQSQFTDFVERYADTTKYEPNAIFAARMLNFYTESAYLELFRNSLSKRFPATRMTKDYGEFYNKMVAKLTQPKAPRGHVEVGSKVPELSLNDPDGKDLTLGSLNGKYVVVNFWASWDKKSRESNAELLKLYQKLKEKRFTVYSVALDNNKVDWNTAINDDKLSWINVSDLKGMNSDAAKLFGVQALPFNFLVDPNGKVMARDVNAAEIDRMITAALH